MGAHILSRGIVIAAVVVTCNFAHAQSAPQLPGVIRIVAPYAAGGTADYLARAFAERLRPLLGNVVVDNVPGANGGVGAQRVAKATPDGSTLFLPGPSVIVINPHVYKNMPYDPVNDFVPVALLTVSASALFVPAGNPANTTAELVAWAKAQNRPLRFGSAGIGGVSHIWIELFGDVAKVQTLHVPYKGINPALVDMLGGQIDGQFADVAPLMPMVKAGRVKMIGVIGPTRNPTLPNVPTFAEQGYPGIDGVSRYGLFAPAKTPPAIVARIADAVANTLRDQEFVRQLAESGMAATYIDSAEFTKLLRADTEWWGKVVARHKISAE